MIYALIIWFAYLAAFIYFAHLGNPASILFGFILAASSVRILLGD